MKHDRDFISSLIVDTELFCGESDQSILVKVNAKRIHARDENVYSEIKLKDESQTILNDSASLLTLYPLMR